MKEWLDSVLFELSALREKPESIDMRLELRNLRLLRVVGKVDLTMASSSRFNGCSVTVSPRYMSAERTGNAYSPTNIVLWALQVSRRSDDHCVEVSFSATITAAEFARLAVVVKEKDQETWPVRDLRGAKPLCNVEEGATFMLQVHVLVCENGDQAMLVSAPTG